MEGTLGWHCPRSVAGHPLRLGGRDVRYSHTNCPYEAIREKIKAVYYPSSGRGQAEGTDEKIVELELELDKLTTRLGVITHKS